MRTKMKVCLLVFALIIALMIPSIVNADVVAKPTVGVDKDSQVKEGDVITVTVGYDQENTTGIYFDLSVDKDSFELVSLKGLDKDGEEVRLAGGYTVSYGASSNTYNQVIYKVGAAITSGNIQKIEVELKAKKDITNDTKISVTNIAKTAVAASEYKGSGSVTIKAIPAEPEQTDPETTNPEPTNPDTTTPDTTTPETPAEQDETPKTGSIDVALVASIVSLILLAGIVTVKKYNK